MGKTVSHRRMVGRGVVKSEKKLIIVPRIMLIYWESEILEICVRLGFAPFN